MVFQKDSSPIQGLNLQEVSNFGSSTWDMWLLLGRLLWIHQICQVFRDVFIIIPEPMNFPLSLLMLFAYLAL